MRLQMRICVAVSILGLVMQVPPALGQQQGAAPSDAQQQAVTKLAEAVRKQIVTNTQYGVFDAIHFAIKGGNTVILKGWASRPTLKSSLENSIKKIPGVASVVNEIEVLPLSPNDDRIRAAVYRSIYGYGPLQRYTSNRGPGARVGNNSIARQAGGITVDPPFGWHAIHIIVKNGNVTLTGVVDSEGDLTMAGMRANMVSGVFSVDNDLQVEGKQG
jgi:hyperosmotically inducible periplasmic protein